MPLDGLRAWIGEVERKLGMRTRVFLVLAAIAIGGAGGAIYLALDTRDTAVSENDVRALQEDLEAQIAGGGSAAGTDVTGLEADLRALEAEVQELRGGKGAAAGAAGTGAATDEPGAGETAPQDQEGVGVDGISDADDAQARLRELVEGAENQNDGTEEQAAPAK